MLSRRTEVLSWRAARLLGATVVAGVALCVLGSPPPPHVANARLKTEEQKLSAANPAIPHVANARLKTEEQKLSAANPARCKPPPIGTPSWSCSRATAPYDKASIARTGGNQPGGNFYRPMWRLLKERLSIKSVLDVGAGRGESVGVFRDEIGVQAIGIDGSIMNALTSEGKVLFHDMKFEPFIPGQIFDLCWSCFVLEHIDEEFLHNALNTFKSCRFLGVSIGMNKNGHHHVTIHPWEPWWDQVFSQFGFVVDPELTALTRKKEYGTEERRGHTWWSGGLKNHAPGKILRNRWLAGPADPLSYYQQIDWTQRVRPI